MANQTSRGLTSLLETTVVADKVLQGLTKVMRDGCFLADMGNSGADRKTGIVAGETTLRVYGT